MPKSPSESSHNLSSVNGTTNKIEIFNLKQTKIEKKTTRNYCPISYLHEHKKLSHF